MDNHAPKSRPLPEIQFLVGWGFASMDGFPGEHAHEIFRDRCSGGEYDSLRFSDPESNANTPIHRVNDPR